MNRRAASRLAWSLWVMSMCLVVAGLVFYTMNPVHRGDALFSLMVALAFGSVGAFVAARRPENALGWILTVIGFGAAVQLFGVEYGTYGLITKPGSVPFADQAVIAFTWTIGLTFGLFITFTLLLFPTDRLPSRRWRIVAWACAAGVALMTLGLGLHGMEVGGRQILGQLGEEGVQATGIARTLNDVGHLLVFFGLAASVVSLFVRRRRASREEREQLRWFLFGATVLALAILFSFPVPDIGLVLEVIGTAAIPVAIGIAILKYRLYDIDVIINKTVVFGALAAFITVVYVGVVVGIGTLIGSGNRPNLALSIVATAIVAVAFQPVRERVQHFANRLVYGKRATPYEVLSEFSDHVAETYATEDVLPKMARAIKDGTGAERADVWLKAGTRLRRAAPFPETQSLDPEMVALNNGRLPSFANTDKAIEVRHQGELLGALTVTKPAGEPLTPAEDKLLSDLASQAGLVLRNVGLTAELLQRLQELKASRQRLVAAQDEERRRLERNLHDGAQQHLVALKTRLSLAKRMTERDPTKAQDLIAKLESDADEALETLRDLARGIYPPLLADQGLKAALEAHARKVSIPVEVTADDISRYPQEIEAAIYFCCLEALQNVTKYAHATRASVVLKEREGELTFVVQDDGRGFDPTTTSKGSGTQNMSDRLEALGGSLGVASSPGQGTTITGRIPVRALEPVA